MMAADLSILYRGGRARLSASTSVGLVLLSLAWAVSSAVAEPPEISDPSGVLPEGAMPGTFPEVVTAANINIAPIPGSTFGGSGSDTLRVQFPSSGPIAWTESRHNEGDVALLIGPFDPNDSSYFPPDDFIDNYRPLADGEPFANTTLAWRVNRDSGALLATVRHNGKDQQDAWSGLDVGITHGIAYFNADFGQGWGFRMNDGVFANGGEGSADLQMGMAGFDEGLGEASFDVATAFFPYSQGWLGAWVGPFDPSVGEATFAHGSPNLEPSVVTWIGHETSAYARVELPGIDSATDGMLFVAPTHGGNASNIAAGAPVEGGWNVAVREDEDFDASGATLTSVGETGFQFLYVPYDAANLVGGHVNGSDGTLVRPAGEDRFGLSRRGAGEYALTIFEEDGQTLATEDDGMLILSVASLMEGSTALADRTFLSYEFDEQSGDFIIQSRAVDFQGGQSENVFGDVLALTDSNFYFAFVDFENPVALLPAVGGIIGDYDNSGQVEQGDLDLVLLNWGADSSTPPAGWSNDLPQGTIDQAELDRVLLNWGSTGSNTVAAVPEPSTMVLCLTVLGVALLRITTNVALQR